MANRQVHVIPHWQQEVSIVAPQMLAKGLVVRGTLNLLDKPGAIIGMTLGKGGATQPASGIVVTIRRLRNGGGIALGGPAFAPLYQQTGVVYGSIANTTVDGNAAAGDYLLPAAATTNIVAGSIVLIKAAASVACVEVHRVSKIDSGVSITLDAPLQYAHTSAQADAVTSLCERWQTTVEGGAVYSVRFDYGADAATGSDAYVEAFADIYTRDSQMS